MISQLVRDVRRAAGLSQAQVAALSGIAQPNLSAFERGRRTPSADNLQRLVEACGLELVAQAGDTTVRASSPVLAPADDELLDALLAERPPGADGAPMALSADERARRLEAVLDLADGLVRTRAGGAP